MSSGGWGGGVCEVQLFRYRWVGGDNDGFATLSTGWKPSGHIINVRLVNPFEALEMTLIRVT